MRKMWFSSRMTATAVFAAGLAVTLIGCSDSDGLPREAVSGEVAIEGEPLAKGLITFLPADSQLPTQAGGPITNGKYSIPGNEGLVPGKYRVVISSPLEDSNKSKDTVASGPGMPPPPPRDAVDAEFNANSTLTAEVKTGGNQFDFEVKKAKASAKKGR